MSVASNTVGNEYGIAALGACGQAALTYAETLGWHVFPLVPGAKNPLTPNGFKGATTDVAQIQRWWTAWPNANIGVPTGAVNRITVLDVDVKPWKDKHGDRTLQALTDQHGELPMTLTQKTWSGGWQFLFAHEPTAPNIADCYGPALDGRNDGGYVVLPPSHVVDGEREGTYTWLSDPRTTPLASMPRWLLVQARTAGARQVVGAPRPVNEWLAVVGGVPEGHRQEELPRVVGMFYRENSPEVARTLAHGYGRGCTPPLSEDEVDSCCDRIEQRELAKASENDTADTATVSDVAMVPVQWLWPGYVAFGAVTLLVGDPGSGKTCVAADLVARTTRGARFADDSPNPHGPATVIFLSAEDSVAYTLRPRLEAATADVARVQVGTGIHSLVTDVGKLERWVERSGARVIIVDPLNAFLPKVQTNTDNEIRAGLKALVQMVERRGVALVAIMHLSKNNDRSVIQRIIGSIGFVAMARTAQAVVNQPEHHPRDGYRYLVPIKNNLGPVPPARAFRVTGDEVASQCGEPIATAKLIWDSASVHVNVDDVVRRGLQGPRPGDTASRLIQDALKNSPQPAQEIIRLLASAGVSESTARRIKERLGVGSVQAADAWWWLPPGWSDLDRQRWQNARDAEANAA